MTSSARRIASIGMFGCMIAVGGGHTAWASGFGLREGAADWTGNAFAGNTAKAYDASTAYANPAGMVRLLNNEVDSSVHYIAPSAEFQGYNQVGPASFTQGTTGTNVVQSAADGAFFGVWSYAPNLKFGFGVLSPFGQRVSNPTNSVERYQSLVSSITDVQATLSAAYAITPEISIGGGPVINYIHARLTQAINLGAVNQLVGDPVADLRGENYSAGFVVSGLYQFSPALRFGVTYRSRIQHDIDGGQRIFVPSALRVVSPTTAAQLLALSSSAKTQITLPDSANLGAYYDIAPNLAVFADLQWTHWSTFNNLTITANNGLSASVTPERFRSTVFGAVGANLRVTEKLMLQTGFGFDQSPVHYGNRTSRIPDYSRVLAGVGATYTVLPGVNVTAAYLHLFSGDAGINNAASSTSGRLIGNFSDTADTASLGVAVKF